MGSFSFGAHRPPYIPTVLAPNDLKLSTMELRRADTLVRMPTSAVMPMAIMLAVIPVRRRCERTLSQAIDVISLKEDISFLSRG